MTCAQYLKNSIPNLIQILEHLGMVKQNCKSTYLASKNQQYDLVGNQCPVPHMNNVDMLNIITCTKDCKGN